jgi:hypothetical protein
MEYALRSERKMQGCSLGLLRIPEWAFIQKEIAGIARIASIPRIKPRRATWVANCEEA